MSTGAVVCPESAAYGKLRLTERVYTLRTFDFLPTSRSAFSAFALAWMLPRRAVTTRSQKLESVTHPEMPRLLTRSPVKWIRE